MAVSQSGRRSGAITGPVLRKAVKKGLAMMLFLAVLIGGGAAAFSLLAAGISALSNVTQSPVQTSIYTAPAGTSTNSNATNGVAMNGGSAANASAQSRLQTGTSYSKAPTVTKAPPAQSGEGVWLGQATAPSGSSVIDRLNQQLDHMNSPVAGAIDNGGVVVGNRVQSAFGRFLAGVVNTLFLEQDAGSTTGTTTSGQ